MPVRETTAINSGRCKWQLEVAGMRAGGWWGLLAIRQFHGAKRVHRLHWRPGRA